MSKANQKTAEYPLKIVKNNRPDSLVVRNGLFKHIVANGQGRLVCIKLYANGWSITTISGTMKVNVKLNGEEIEINPKGNMRKGSLVLSDYSPIMKPKQVDKVLVDSIYGQFEMRNEKDNLIEFFLDGQKVGCLKNPEKRNVEYNLPKNISLADSAILFCIGMLIVRYDDIDIV